MTLKSSLTAKTQTTPRTPNYGKTNRTTSPAHLRNIFIFFSWRSWRLGGSNKFSTPNRLLTALLCLGLTLPALAASPTKLNVSYSITRAGQPIGEIQEVLEINGGNYRMESITKSVGVLAVFLKETITEISAGTIDANGFHPQQYTYRRNAKPGKNAEAKFDPEKQTATFNFSGKTESEALPSLLQDRLSLGYQLRYWPKAQSSLTLPVSNGKGITDYLVQRSGEETVSVPAGKFQTTRYTRERTKDHDGVSVWVNDRIAAPIKIVIIEKKGAQTEQVLTRVTSE